MTKTVRVGIACQGGGAQTAFTAGVLDSLMNPDLKAQFSDRTGFSYEIVGLSGTSGGAVCAALAWADLILGRRGTLEQFWRTGYPDGNTTLPIQEAMWKQYSDLCDRGRLPWLPVVDWMRNSSGRFIAENRQPFEQLMPVHYTPALKSYYFKFAFDMLDSMVSYPGRACIESTRVIARHILEQITLFDSNEVTNKLFEELISASPIFLDSRMRKEFDAQNAFIHMIETYLPKDDRDEITKNIEEIRRAHKEPPQLLIGSADVLGVHEDGDYLHLEKYSGMTEEELLESMYVSSHDRGQGRKNNFRVFQFDKYENIEDLPRIVCASSAIPEIMRAVELNDRHYWDALYSANPPLYKLAFLHGHKHHPNEEQHFNPEEIWLIRINSATRDEVPNNYHDIADRKNELAGNLSTLHEMRMVRKVDALTTALTEDPSCKKRIRFGFISIGKGLACKLDYLDKLDRSKMNIGTLYEDGRKQGIEFLARWEAPNAEYSQAETTKVNKKSLSKTKMKTNKEAVLVDA